jgi:hypothetical protein
MTSPGNKLADLIKKAISDLKLTTAEHDAIMAQASQDKVIDPEEQTLLRQLQEMLANGTIERVAK